MHVSGASANKFLLLTLFKLCFFKYAEERKELHLTKQQKKHKKMKLI